MLDLIWRKAIVGVFFVGGMFLVLYYGAGGCWCR